ncbi:MAG: hypothetical protein IH994_10685 [Proteobacteria bacterium]|nr:hypothetical protein [Pseudomonadota bacterium]
MPEASPTEPNRNDSKAASAFLVSAASAWPFLSFLDGNKGEFVDLAVVLYAFLVSLGLLWLGFFATGGLVPSPGLRRRLVNSGCVFFVLLFIYGSLDNFMKAEFEIERARYILMTWAVAALSGVALTWRFSGSRHSTMALAVGAATMCLVAALEIRLPVKATATPAPLSTADGKPHAGGLPNVYFIIFDAYGRGDMLRKYLNYDNGAFLNALEKRGFVVLEKSRSNYPVSFLSIAATLNMGPLFDAGKGALDGYVRYQTLLAGHNPAIRMFRSLGYSYVHAPPGGWGGTRCQGVEDVCIWAGKEWINETNLAILAMTPLEIVIRKIWPQSIVFSRSLFPDVVRRLGDIRGAIEKPMFVFAHILVPHDRIYGENCKPVYTEPFFEEFIRPHEDTAYVNTVKCLNRQILENLDIILRADPDALVVLQGDHGFILTPMLSQPLDQWDAPGIEMRYGILNVLRVPGRCRESLYPSMTAFNTFRFIEGCLKGIAPKYIADRSFRATTGQKDVLPLYSRR